MSSKVVRYDPKFNLGMQEPTFNEYEKKKGMTAMCTLSDGGEFKVSKI